MAAMDFPPNPTQGQVYSNGSVSYTYNGYAWVGGAPGSSIFAPLLSPVFTGDPRAPTPTVGDNDTSIATTAFVTANAVKKGGDVMTGSLAVQATVSARAFSVDTPTGVDPFLALNKPASGRTNAISGRVVSSPRWVMELGDSIAESGSTAGSNFTLSRYNDAGAFLNSPLTINRASGRATMENLAVSFSGATVPTVGFAIGIG